MIYYLGLGSNVGNSLNYLKMAEHELNSVGKVNKKSSLYKSKPVGNKNQDDFFNAVVEFEIDDPPAVLLKKLKGFEVQIGRKDSYRWGPREIDIDIIDLVGPKVEKDDLSIPHKEMENRDFVLIPLSEVNPSYKTREGKTVKDLINDVNKASKLKLITKNW